MLVALVTFFRAQALSVVRMLLDLGAEVSDLLFVVFEAGAQMLFHFFDFGFGWEEAEEIFYFEDTLRFVSDDLESIFDLHFLGIWIVIGLDRLLRSLFGAGDGVLEELLGYLHPELLLYLDIFRLVCILLGQIIPITLKCQFHCLRVQVQDPVQDDLSVFEPINLLTDLSPARCSLLVFFLDQFVLFLFAQV